MMAVPQSIHVFPVTLKTLPYDDASLDALFYVELGDQFVDRLALFEEAFRILQPQGLFFINNGKWAIELDQAGFSDAMDDFPEATPTNWRAAYLTVQNARLHITELEKAHVYPLKSPFFKTAVCVTKPILK
ncbi:MAG: methyltransferase domain-containing protein [Chloroflexota bacterium]